MSEYYEMTVTDKRAGRALKRILLLVSLFILIIALFLLIFAFFTTFWLLIPFAVLCVASAVLSNIGHLLTRDYMYIFNGEELIIKRLYAERYNVALVLPLNGIIEVRRQISSDAVKYTPFRYGVTLVADNKSYLISPDDYLLALIMKQKE